jgi:hypothetical protein
VARQLGVEVPDAPDLSDPTGLAQELAEPLVDEAVAVVEQTLGADLPVAVDDVAPVLEELSSPAVPAPEAPVVPEPDVAAYEPPPELAIPEPEPMAVPEPEPMPEPEPVAPPTAAEASASAFDAALAQTDDVIDG